MILMSLRENKKENAQKVMQQKERNCCTFMGVVAFKDTELNSLQGQEM